MTCTNIDIKCINYVASMRKKRYNNTKRKNEFKDLTISFFTEIRALYFTYREGDVYGKDE